MISRGAVVGFVAGVLRASGFYDRRDHAAPPDAYQVGSGHGTRWRVMVPPMAPGLRDAIGAGLRRRFPGETFEVRSLLRSLND